MAWGAVAISFLVLDLIWLGIIGRPIYAELMGDLLRPEAYVPAAVIFYVFFVTTVYGYGVVGSCSPIDALKRGASLGFVTYATYELTNWAVITGWPALLVPIDIAWGIVLTGGSAKMEGAVDLAEEIFHMPVRLASPQTVTGLTEMVKNPIYSTGVGLLKYGQKQVITGAAETRAPVVQEISVMEKMKTWIKGNF